MNIRLTCLLLVFVCRVGAQTTCVVSVNTAQITNPDATKLLGITYEGRSGGDFDAGPSIDPLGYHDPATGVLLQGIKPLWDRIPLAGVRYPGNLISFNWNWSYTIGPYAGRIPVPLGPGGSNAQKLQFGFDEFMDMVAAKGLSTAEVQIMVNIYPSVGQSNPAVLAADWVEYCNAPNNGSNPRGGTDWAALRALYGHPVPYGVRIWNIGNEPWTSNEFNSTTAGADLYMAAALPIIDSMLAADPSIKITLPAVGNAGSAWNTEIVNPLAPNPVVNKIYGLSPHAFYDVDNSTTNPTPAQALALFTNLAAAANTKNLKIVAGDHAHFAPVSDPDKAMRWEGALATADFLLGLSQISNIELANFWIYGNVKATWHPIRKNANGTYTMMAAAQLYEQLFPWFYKQGLQAAIASQSGGGPVANMRASSFRKPDLSKISVMVVNTDLNTANEVVPPVFPGYFLQTARLVTATSVNDDTLTASTVSALANGNYTAPPFSLLILDYTAGVLPVQFAEPLRAMPTSSGIAIEWATAGEHNCRQFTAERSGDGQRFAAIGTVKANGNTTAYHLYKIADPKPFAGINYYRIRQEDNDGGFMYSKIVSARFGEGKLLVAPNPVGNVLIVSSTGLINRIEIYNSGGVLLQGFNKPGAMLNLAGLKQGVYFLKVFGYGEYVEVRKIIKL